MTTTLDAIFSEVDARVIATRETAIFNYSARKATTIAGASSTAAAGVTSAASPFGGGDLYGDTTQSSAARQYRASTQDSVAIAIRPIATRIADQIVRAGTKRIAGQSAAGMMTKSASDYLLKSAPQQIRRKAISEGITVLESHPFIDAIENPNPLFSQWSLMFCTAWSVASCGEAVWIIDPTQDEAGNPVVRIWYYPRNWVSPIHGDGMAFKAWKLTPPGVTDDLPPIPAELVCHFFCPDPGNPLKALSSVQSQAKSINVESKIRDAHVATMNNIIEPGLILTVGHMDAPPGQSGTGPRIELTREQREQIVETVKLAYRCVTHFGDPLILDRLIEDAKPFRSNPVDLALQEGYMLVNRSILQGIGTSRVIAGETEGANRATAYVADEIFCANVVNPFITLMSQTMTRTFGRLESMRPSRKNQSLVLWIEEAKPHDAELRLRQMQFLADKNWIKPSEARESVDLPPEKELDDEWEERRRNPPVPPMAGTPTQGKPPAAGSADDEKQYDLYGDGILSKAANHTPPESAQGNARRVLKWKQKHGDDVKGMTSVGWNRARQLASGKPISLHTVRRMAQFNRHRSNYEKARAKQKREGGNPWEYAGIVAWLGWGGTSGINWAIRTSKASSKAAEENEMLRKQLRSQNGRFATVSQFLVDMLSNKLESEISGDRDTGESSAGNIDSKTAGSDKLQTAIAEIWSDYP